MSSRDESNQDEVLALKVRQWLTEWNDVKWNTRQLQSKPQEWFYQFSVSAKKLKRLSGIYPRATQGRKRASEDTGIQRRHDVKRSKNIAEFIKFGHPWAELRPNQRKSNEFNDLRKPGWLPTSVVINILGPKDRRNGKNVDTRDLLKIADNDDGTAKVLLPKQASNANWEPANIPPVEVIDGQHRLWAFDETTIDEDFQLPVIAFVGLDLSWQAYLFYTINIKPKRINASLAFDLYPLLRTEDWLRKFEGHIVYREARAQELVDILYSYQKSPWFNHINMLGETNLKSRRVSQAAWIRSLLATYIKSWAGRKVKVGGLYGAPVGSHQLVLPWTKFEQAVFLIVIGTYLKSAIKNCKANWANSLRKNQSTSSDLFEKDRDPAFYSNNSLLNHDQGIRAFLSVTNDLCYVRSDTLGLAEWGRDTWPADQEEDNLNNAIISLKKQTRINEYFKEMTHSLANYDWRASSAPGLSEADAQLKASFRGSGGYGELRKHLLRHLEKCGGETASAAGEVLGLVKG